MHSNIYVGRYSKYKMILIITLQLIIDVELHYIQ